MSLDRSVRRSRVLLAAAVLVAPTVLAVTAAAGSANAATAQAGAISVSDSKVTSRSERVTVSVKVPLLQHGDLGIIAPGAGKATKVSSGDGGQTLSYSFMPKHNGTWKAVYDQSLLGLLKNPDKTRSIVVAAAPAKPSGLSADASSGTVMVRWHKGSEPDLTSYRVTVGGGSKRFSVGSACGDTTCGAALPAPASGKAPVTVTANRSSPDGTLSSTPASTSADVPAAGRGGAGSSGGGGGYGSFPTPTLGSGGGGGRYAGVPPGSWPGVGAGQSSAPDPYPSFGLQPSVAPLATSRSDHASRPLVEPLAAGSSAGQTAVPVAMGLIFVLTMAHIWLWTRSGRRLRPELAAGVHRVTRRFRRRP